MCSNYLAARRESLSRYNLPLPDFSYTEMYPGRSGPVLANFDKTLWLEACFGLVPPWARELKIVRSTYNARSETVGEKPSFRSAWKKRQLCVIPADAFYEPCYETGKPVRWRIERADGAPFGLAGLWERHMHDDGLPRWSMSMLTLNADEHPLMRRFHAPADEKRSVVVLGDDEWDDWLSASTEAQVRSFLRPFEPALMTAVADPRPPRGKAVAA